METKQPQDVLRVLNEAIEGLASSKWKDEIRHGLMTPIRERRVFQTDRGDLEGDLWLFYSIPGRRVALAYSDEGYALLGMHWGLVFRDDDQFGSSGGWYNTLRDLIADSGYFEPE